MAGAASTNGDTAPDSDNSEGSELVLENLVMDSILSALFSTPSSSSRAVYYHSLVGELCKISPQTVAPALGKCIRKMYSGLGQTENMGESDIVLGPEGIRRYAEWFAVHLSNFGFHWRWPEWLVEKNEPEEIRESEANVVILIGRATCSCLQGIQRKSLSHECSSLKFGCHILTGLN